MGAEGPGLEDAWWCLGQSWWWSLKMGPGRAVNGLCSHVCLQTGQPRPLGEI